MYALRSEKIKAIFTHEEMDTLKKKVTKELIPNISQLTRSTQAQYDNSKDEPDDHMRFLLEVYEILQDEFNEDEIINEKVTLEIETIKDWIKTNNKETPELIEREKLSEVSTSPSGEGERSIFDDIDEI